ncbi:MAG: RidA family protein [Pseudomonadota bacterium]
MKIKFSNAEDAPKAVGSYSQAVHLSNHSELVFVSGQVPETIDGDVPDNFEDQCRLVWKNIERQLAMFDMTFNNLVKVTTFLSHPSQRQAQSQIRNEILKDHQPALTVIICDIYLSKWLLEIEAIAAR